MEKQAGALAGQGFSPFLTVKLRENTDTYRQTLEERLGAGVRMTQEAASARPIALSCTPAPYFRRWEMLGLSDYFTNYRRNHKIP